MINYEKIKAMSVDEMGRFLCFSSTCTHCAAYEYCEYGTGTGFIKWLESEVDESEDNL